MVQSSTTPLPDRPAGVSARMSAGVSARANISAIEERRRQMLSALDIDVWQVRSEPELETTAAAAAPGKSGGPAAARALLEDTQADRGRAGSGGALTASSVSAESSAARAATTPAETGTGQQQLPPQPAVNLLCLSGPHGVLLSNLKGLSPLAQRLLGDIFQAAMRIAAASASGAQVAEGKKAAGKLKVQKLRFNWPPDDGGAGLGTDAPTSRALRGFLGRQLEGKPSAFVLYTAPELSELLTEAQLALQPERLIFTGNPDVLLADGAAKRGLWQTLNTL